MPSPYSYPYYNPRAENSLGSNSEMLGESGGGLRNNEMLGRYGGGLGGREYSAVAKCSAVARC